MSLQVQPLPGGIGAECRGLALDAPIPDEVREQLYQAWIDAGIIVFRNGATSPEQQLRLSRCFGELDVHPVKNLVTESDYPELMVLDSEDQARQMVLCRETDPDDHFMGYIPWHSDLIFTTTPNHGALLRAVVVPGQGGHTAWIDTIAAYDGLDEALKRDIEGLEVEYRFCNDLTRAKYGKDPHIHKVSGTTNFPEFPPVAQPMVWRHPVSGRKSLNISPLHLEAVVGMEEPDSHELLTNLVDHVTSRDFSYVHQWQPNDMVLWDNWRTLHSALGYPVGERRVVHRTTISGDVEMGRILAA